MSDARFSGLGEAQPYALYTNVEDDPLDAVPDLVGGPRLMVDLAWFVDVSNWDD